MSGLRRFHYQYTPYFYEQPDKLRSRACVTEFRTALRELVIPFPRWEGDEFRSKVVYALHEMLPALRRDLNAAIKREKWVAGRDWKDDPFRRVSEQIDRKIQFWYGLRKRRPFSTRIERYDVLDVGRRVYELNPQVEPIIMMWLKMEKRGEARVDKNFLYLPYQTPTGSGEFRVCSGQIIPFWKKMFGSHPLQFSDDFAVHPRHFTVTYSKWAITLTARDRRGVLMDIIQQGRGPISQREIIERLNHKGILAGRSNERGGTVVVSLTAGRAHKFDRLYAERHETFLRRKEKVQAIYDRVSEAAVKAAREIAQSSTLQKENALRMVKSAEAKYRHAQNVLWDTSKQAFLKKSLPDRPFLFPFEEERWHNLFDLKARYRKDNWKSTLERRNASWKDARNALYDAYNLYRRIFGDIFTSELNSSLTMTHPVVAALAA